MIDNTEDTENRLSINTRWYIDQRVRTLEEKLQVQFKANAMALEKFESTLKDKLERMNEIREAMKDQSATFITRDEMNAIEDKHTGEWQALSQRIWILFSGLAVILIGGFLMEHFLR